MALRVCLALLLAIVASAGPAWAHSEQGKKPAHAFASDVASIWFEALYDVVKTERTAPPQASRIYGITAVALYEAVVSGEQKNRSLVGQLNGLTSVPQPKKDQAHHWPTVANNTLATVIRGLYASASPASLDLIDDVAQHFADEFQPIVPRDTYRRSVDHGRAVGNAILAWSATDGFSTLNNCPYVPASVPGAWVPTPPGFVANPLQPCWGQLRPMVLASGAECGPPPHPAFSLTPGSAFHTAALEVYNVGKGLTAEQKTIANYWADGAGATGTPPGHWIAIVSQIARNDDLSLIEAAEAFARVGIAVHDAFIGCWFTKYVFNLQRPVTYIRNNIDATFSPFIATPAFPSYSSGHSSQSGAAAMVLTDLFGITQFTDTTHTDHGLVPAQSPRTFGSFDEAAAEAALSRLYGGIHYSFDNDEGLSAGQCIARAILERVEFRHDHAGGRH
jgi:membrane-associated phospholipid phosphatase